MRRHLAYAGAAYDIFTDGAIDDIYRFSSGAANQQKSARTRSSTVRRTNIRALVSLPSFSPVRGQFVRHQQDNLRRQLLVIMYQQCKTTKPKPYLAPLL